MELLEWIKERLLLSMQEWQRLHDRCAIDGGVSANALVDPVSEKLVRLIPEPSAGADHHLIVAAEMAAGIADALYVGRTAMRWVRVELHPQRLHDISSPKDNNPMPTAMELVGQWLRFYGPVPTGFIIDSLGLDKEMLSGVLSDLIETRSIISGILIRRIKENPVCDADNFDTLLRMARRRRKPTMQPREIRELALVPAHFQGLTRTGDSQSALGPKLQPLMCRPLPQPCGSRRFFPRDSTITIPNGWIG